VNRENFENSIGINLVNSEGFIIARNGKILLFNDQTYLVKDKIDLKLGDSDTREPMEILSMNTSADNQYIGIFIGKQLIKDEELILRLVILERDIEDPNSKFYLLKDIDMAKHSLQTCCKQFFFDNLNQYNLFIVGFNTIVNFDFMNEQK